MFGAESRETLEGVGSAFSTAQLLHVRVRTRSALNEIAATIVPGMAEEEARRIAADVLRHRVLRKGWHKILVRFGRNTVKSFDDPSEPGVVLGEHDIFFIDIGPIFDLCEGDAGGTFAVGHDLDMIRASSDVEMLWWRVRQAWLDHGLTGSDLYAFAADQAATMGWTLNLEWTGHRLGEFPHDAHYDGTLSDVAFRPSSGLWVLEIQIRHPNRPFGAFFEDLLVEDDELQRSVHSVAR